MTGRNVVIRVENLSKAYLIGRRERATTLGGAIVGLLRSPARNLRMLRRLNTFDLLDDDGDDDILWALKNLSFEVERGEVLGIIGRNGAGKSTLLKILSRVAEPTRGRALLQGRVSALLEVGTGFHPELTGRENVYLNGTILGMSKAEVDAKFHEIVDFSGVERFLDTPVKRYSSGMRVRLAFSVAAHLEPEILIVDEVLSVGDAEFQKRCLGKMEDVATGSGRTVLFVSHNLPSVQHLCSRAILLENGRVVHDSDPATTVSRYLAGVEGRSQVAVADRVDRRGANEWIVSDCVLASNGHAPSEAAVFGEPAEIRFTISRPVRHAKLKFTIYDSRGVPISTFLCATDEIDRSREFQHLTCRLHQVTLVPGEYRVNVALSVNDVNQDHLEGVLMFRVENGQRVKCPVGSMGDFGRVWLPHDMAGG